MDRPRACRLAMHASGLLLGAFLVAWAATPDVSAQAATNSDESASATADTTEEEPTPKPTPTPPPPPPASLSGLPPAPPASVDEELLRGLHAAGLLDEWVALAPTDERLSLLRVSDDSGFDSDPARDTFMELLGDFNDVRTEIATLTRARRDTELAADDTRLDIERVDRSLLVLDGRIETTEDHLVGLGADLDQIVTALQTVAIGMYMNDDPGPLAVIGDVGAFNTRADLAARVDAALDDLTERRLDLEGRIAEQRAILADHLADKRGRLDRRAELAARLERLEGIIVELTDRLLDRTRRRTQLREAMPEAIETAHRARMILRPVELPFSLVTLDAYVKAADLVPERRPTCGVRWELLAGIAKIESGHATFGGARVDADGELSERILGPLLDGSLEGTMVIDDTDAGRLDGNGEFDAAVGPFQFIPGTWSAHALDATDDGIASPHNLYDAALTAAGYLCATTDVVTDAEIERSVLSYNRSRTYLANVTRYAREYATTVSLPVSPLEIELVPEPGDGPGDGTGTPLELPFSDD